MTQKDAHTPEKASSSPSTSRLIILFSTVVAIVLLAFMVTDFGQVQETASQPATAANTTESNSKQSGDEANPKPVKLSPRQNLTALQQELDTLQKQNKNTQQDAQALDQRIANMDQILDTAGIEPPPPKPNPDIQEKQQRISQLQQKLDALR